MTPEGNLYIPESSMSLKANNSNNNNNDDINNNCVYMNETTRAYNKFVYDVLGLEKVALKGWPKFRGGLDTSNNKTGTHSLYKYEERDDMEYMFHSIHLMREPFYAALYDKYESELRLLDEQRQILVQDEQGQEEQGQEQEEKEQMQEQILVQDEQGQEEQGQEQE